MRTYTRYDHSGTGPGEITPDGCSVEMYARLPENGETDVIAAAVPPGSTTLLELGAGAGRMTRPLLARGFHVTAVDESAAMLAKAAELAPDGSALRTVCGAIEDLRLDERFDVVTLTSFLVNTADPAQRAGILRTCARHVADDGCVIVQREQDGLHEDFVPGQEWHRGGMTIRSVSREPVGEGVARIRFEYAFEDAEWSQTFYSYFLSRPDFEAALAAASLTLDAYLTDDGCWARAVPSRGASRSA
ncbi:class I SAM-dependent methyltransferase [Streptomyces sp. NPDC054796]